MHIKEILTDLKPWYDLTSHSEKKKVDARFHWCMQTPSFKCTKFSFTVMYYRQFVILFICETFLHVDLKTNTLAV